MKSKINKGTNFSFTLPFLKAKPGSEVEIADSDAYLIDPENKNIKVLVVEDMPLNQLLMKTILDDFGFERDIAENGKIAIVTLQPNSYAIILMHLQMPDMNVFEATAYIRNTMKSKIPIIALTAYVTTVAYKKCKAIDTDDYIPTPLAEKPL